MADCTNCGAYTKYNGGLCYSCYHKGKKIGTKKRSSNNDKSVSKLKFPHHTGFYRDFHIIEREVVEYIFSVMGWTYAKKKLFGYSDTGWITELEVNGWDMVIEIHDTPDKRLKEMIKRAGHFDLYIEYKSSVKEWGKQIDEFMRQIKRRKIPYNGIPILLSFDPEFEQYEQAFEMANITLITLPKEMFDPKVLKMLKEQLNEYFNKQ